MESGKTRFLLYFRKPDDLRELIFHEIARQNPKILWVLKNKTGCLVLRSLSLLNSSQKPEKEKDYLNSIVLQFLLFF